MSLEALTATSCLLEMEVLVLISTTGIVQGQKTKEQVMWPEIYGWNFEERFHKNKYIVVSPSWRGN